MDEVVCRECKRQRNPPTCQLRVGLDKAEEIQEDTNLTEDEAVAYALHDLQNLGLDIIAHLTGVAPRDVPSEDVARGCVALELMAAREKFAGQEASDEHLITDGGQTPAELLFGSRIHELPFLFACTNDGDTFIDERHCSETDRSTLREYEAPRGSGYDLIVAETGEVLMSGGELTANTQWEALTCEVCSEAFLFISVEAAPESCPECGATEDCGEENRGEE